MKTLFENCTPSFATRIVEHNGKKFRMKLEATTSMPLATIGSDYYHGLSIMVEDGTFKQITDAKEIGSSVRHGGNCDVEKDFPKLCKDFEKYIKAVY